MTPYAPAPARVCLCNTVWGEAFHFYFLHSRGGGARGAGRVGGRPAPSFFFVSQRLLLVTQAPSSPPPPPPPPPTVSPLTRAIAVRAAATSAALRALWLLWWNKGWREK